MKQLYFVVSIKCDLFTQGILISTYGLTIKHTNSDCTKVLLQLRLCCVYAASMLRLLHFDEVNMFNFPASLTVASVLRLCLVG
jgi:hypothetical protein